MTDATMTTIDVAALNVLADWFDKLPDGGMGKEHFDGLVIVVSELLSRAVAPAPARPANAELVERLCSSVQALIAALPPNPAEGLFLQAKATAEQCRRTLAAMLSASPSPPALEGAGREAAIEECAKVAENCIVEGHHWRRDIAAAIRSLKETR